MSRAARLILGTATITALAVGAALLSARPAYRMIPEGTGVVKLSFSHGGERNCRELTADERAKLPPNMRRTEVCERKRPPVVVELDIDGATVYRAALPPSGIAGDGPSHAYQRFVLPAGEYRVALRLRDTARTEGFDHEAEQRILLAPEQNLAIDFRPEAGGFTFR